MSSRFYRSFEEFAREEIRPMTKAGWSLDELDIDGDLSSDTLSFDKDAEYEDED